MINSIALFILKMNNKQVTDGNYFMCAVEFLATIVMFAIYRNT